MGVCVRRGVEDVLLCEKTMSPGEACVISDGGVPSHWFSLVSLVPRTIAGVFPLGSAPGSQGEDPPHLSQLQAEEEVWCHSQRRFMHPLTQQMFIEHQLYARHYTRGCEHKYK